MTSPVTPLNSTSKADLIIAVACAAAFALALFYFKPETTSAAYNFGQAIAYAFFAIVVLGVTALSSAGKKRLAFAYFALLGSFFTGTMIAAQQLVEKERAAINAILPDIEKDAKAFLDSRAPQARESSQTQRTEVPSPAIQATPPSGSSDSAEKYRQVQLFLSSLFQRQVNLQNEYSSELNATGYITLLDPVRLKSDPTGFEGFDILQRAHSVVLKHRAKSEAMIENLPREIRQYFTDSQLDPRSVEKIIEGFEKSVAVTQLRAKRSWDLEEAAVAEIRAVLVLFASSPGWQAGTDSLLFPLDGQAAAFNAHMGRIHEITQEQESIRKSADEGLTVMLSKLKSLGEEP